MRHTELGTLPLMRTNPIEFKRQWVTDVLETEIANIEEYEKTLEIELPTVKEALREGILVLKKAEWPASK